MGKHRRRSWIPGHEEILEDHFDRLRFKKMPDSDGTVTNLISNGHDELANGSAKIFQATTYFPIAQRSLSPIQTILPSNGISTTKTLHKSTIITKEPLSNKSLVQCVLESLAIAFYVFGFVFAPFVFTAISITILFFPPLWPIAFGYFCWYIYDYKTPKKGSRPWQRFRQMRVWTLMANYFPMRLIKTSELPADRNYIVGAHPHGILSCGTFLAFCTEAVGFAEQFPGLNRRYAVTLPIQYWFPIRRELLMLTNTISSEVAAIEHVLEENECGTVVAIVPGGAAEALDSSTNNYRLTLKKRKGFVKLALKYGASLVPMYTFGETSTFKQMDNPEGSRIRKLQNCLKSIIGITMPYFYGCCGFSNRYFGFIPFRTPLNTVVGKPIFVEKVEEPSYKQISDLHKKYCQELSNLFDAHKQKYGVPATAKLEFV